MRNSLDSTPAQTTPPLVELCDVKREFRSSASSHLALDTICLSIKRREFVAVVGPSGSGKTTLLNVMGAIDQPTSGEVRIDGVELGCRVREGLASFRLRSIGFIFQHFSLIPVLSVFENVELPLLFRNEMPPSQRTTRVTSALQQVGLAHCATRLPSGLSGGEMQLTALARALAGDPYLIVADEPTAHLDADTSAAVMTLMRETNRSSGTTFVFSTHDASLLRFADRVITLRSGRLA